MAAHEKWNEDKAALSACRNAVKEYAKQRNIEERKNLELENLLYATISMLSEQDADDVLSQLDKIQRRTERLTGQTLDQTKPLSKQVAELELLLEGAVRKNRVAETLLSEKIVEIDGLKALGKSQKATITEKNEEIEKLKKAMGDFETRAASEERNHYSQKYVVELLYALIGSMIPMLSNQNALDVERKLDEIHRMISFIDFDK
jgi:superfamily I DNA/RNA helicase